MRSVSHADAHSYLLAWQDDLFQPYQVTTRLLPRLHQREGSHSMDTLPAADSLCVLSFFHTARFIGKLHWQPLSLHVSQAGSVCNDLLMG